MYKLPVQEPNNSAKVLTSTESLHILKEKQQKKEQRSYKERGAHNCQGKGQDDEDHRGAGERNDETKGFWEG